MAVYNKRENKKGTCYQAIIRVTGYKTLCKTFKLKSQAQAWAEPIERAMKDGLYSEILEINNNKENINTVAELIQYFRENIAPNRYADYKKYDIMFDWWTFHIGTIKIRNLSAAIISKCKEQLKTETIHKGKDKFATRSNNTINKYLMCISAILTYAVKDLELIETNPCSKVSKMPKPKGRTRFLSVEEISTFLKACKDHSFMIYIFALISLATGARYSEVLHLNIENIDFQNSQVYYLNTKNKEHRGVPISNEILLLLKKYLIENKITSGCLFRPKRDDGKYPYIKGELEQIIKQIGLEDFHIHDLRHTTASYIAMNGGSLLDIAEILGHKSLVMARRYSHLTKKHTAAVLNKVTDKIIPGI